MPLVAALLSSALAFAGDDDVADARRFYDVVSYHLDLTVQPDVQVLSGSVTVEVLVTADAMDVLELDLVDELTVSGVAVGDSAVSHQHGDDRLVIALPEPAGRGARVVATVHYSGSPQAVNDFDGFHWTETPDGRPWINTSCQTTGAHAWWPCKASYFHPEDKPERVSMDITVPDGLYAVSNGALVEIVENTDGTRTFRWAHGYPLETYVVTLNVAPYVVVDAEPLVIEGIDEPVPFSYYVLPSDLPKAALQFEQVPELVHIFSEAFGPFPFPESKFGLVQTNFWGMEHSTAVAYGSSFPAWCELHGEEDPYAGRNRDFDYILVHEVAHEWWGNAVSTNNWGDFWIHEGFGTYAEAVYVEHTQGRAAADEFVTRMARRLGSKSRLFRGEGVDSGEAYAGVVYFKGAAVLHALRHYVDDDDAWWRSLRAFNMEFRYANASTTDFRAVLERETGKPWQQFFDEWVFGEGVPIVKGQITPVSDIAGHRLDVRIENKGSGATQFHVPVDVSWLEGGVRNSARVLVTPGHFEASLPCRSEPSEVRVDHLRRIPGTHSVVVAASGV